MTIKELLEQAHLDALGLLEPDDQAAFELAFASAPAPVRAQVRAEQARWSRMEDTLPHVEPSPDLRERVLDAVSQAMLEQEAGAERAGAFTFLPTRRVSPLWRAGAVALTVCVAVLGGAFVMVSQENTRMIQRLTNDRGSDLWTSIYGREGYELLKDTVFGPDVKRFAMQPTDGTPAGSVGPMVVLVSTRTKEAAFFCSDVPAHDDDAYRLVVVDEKNTVLRVLGDEFKSQRNLQTMNLSGAISDGMRLAVCTVRHGQNLVGSTAHVVMTATISL